MELNGFRGEKLDKKGFEKTHGGIVPFFVEKSIEFLSK